ncbi:MAG: PDZ domain-containing protein [Cyanobacteria bacterium P01_H01_bin.74]
MLIQPNDYPYIDQVYSGTPAANNRIHSGERIIAINGIDVFGRNKQTVDKMISNQPGDTVTLLLQTNSTSQREVTLTVMPLSVLSSRLRPTFDQVSN